MAEADSIKKLIKDSLDVKEFRKILGDNANVSRDNLDEIKKMLNKFADVADSISDLNKTLQSNNEEIRNLQQKGTLSAEEQENLARLQTESLSLQKQLQSRQTQEKQLITSFKNKTNVDLSDKTNRDNVIESKKRFDLKNITASAKGSLINEVTQILGSVASAGTDIYVASLQKDQNIWMATQKQNMNQLEAQSKITQRNLQLFGQTQQAVFGSVINQITQGANEGAFAAAQAMTDIATSGINNMLQTQQDLLHMTNANTLAIKEAEKENQKLSHQQLQTTASILQNLSSYIPGIGSVITQFVVSIGKTVLDSYVKIAEATTEIEFQKLQKRIEISEKQQEIFNQMINTSIDASKQIANSAVSFAQTIEKVVMNTEHVARQTANFLGIGFKNIDNFEKRFFDISQKLLFKGNGEDIYLNKSYEDMMKMQQSYGEATDRNQVMTHNDYLKSFQLGMVLGDDQLAGSLLGSMDYFNKSIANGTELIYDMFQAANKAGVSNRKFAKDLQQNLRLAQKYTFREGVKGMMEMSIWSQKTRFNMASIEGVIEKGLNGGLEGIIQQSAQLQVLGGNAAMLANPLSMMYEMGNDPGALMKRINDTIKGFGTFNSATGEVDFAMNDALHLRAIASAYGMDATELRNQASQAIKNQRIDKQLNGLYNEEERALLYNKATFKNGEWQVSVGGQYKSINDISGNDWIELKPTEEAIEDYVAKIYSILEKEGGVKVYSNARFAGETKENIQKEQIERIQNTLEIINTPETREAMKSVITEASQYVTKQQKIANENLISSTTQLSNVFNLFVEQTKKTIESLSDAESTFTHSLAWTIAKITGDIEAQQREEAVLTERIGVVPSTDDKSINDGFASSKGHSMLMSASHITPINDGNVQLAKSHPQDSALFAKAGGPFDTLFNGVLSQINNIHSALFGSPTNNQPFNINLNMNGRISLDCNNTSVDVTEELKNNPMFVKAMTQEIIIQMSKNVNGGKGTMFNYVKSI